jgi:GXGXG motif
MEMPINNLDRTTGTILSYEISTRYGEAGLPDDTIHVKFTGHAGQSLGFCLAKGVHLEVCVLVLLLLSLLLLLLLALLMSLLVLTCWCAATTSKQCYCTKQPLGS